MRLIALAALLSVASTLQACTPEQKIDSEAIFTALGAPLPAGLADPAVAADVEVAAVVQDAAPVPEPVVVPPPPPPQYGEPGYVAGYMEKGYTGPLPCPGSVFRVLTCDDDGVSWHWLGAQMEWLN